MVRVSFTYSDSILSECFRAHWRRSIWSKLYLPLVAGGFAFAAVQYASRGIWVSAPWMIVTIVLLAAPKLNEWQCKRSIRKAPLFSGDFTCELSERGLRVETPGFQSELAWPQVQAIVESKTGFMVYTQQSAFYYLPFSSFTSATDVDSARSYFPPDKFRGLGNR